MDLIQALAAELGKDPRHVENVVHLLDEGNTIPFIARYRKELHGAMDDTSLRTLEERLQYLRGLEERREAVKKSIDEQGKLTDELTAAIDSAKTLAEVEDLYRPYKQKRRTRATMAKEKGLKPLAALLFAQERLEQTAAKVRGADCGTIVIGTAYNCYYEWVTRMTAAFRTRHPGVAVRIVNGTSSELAEMVKDHRTDFCLISRRSGCPSARMSCWCWCPKATRWPVWTPSRCSA